MKRLLILIFVLLAVGCGDAYPQRHYHVVHDGVTEGVRATYYVRAASGGGCVQFYVQPNGWKDAIPVATFCRVSEITSDE